MQPTENIAVCCFYFPPLNSVGGRRWVKFAKYLSKKNIRVTFFVEDSARFPADIKNKGWEKDLEFQHEIISIDSQYPAVINSGPKNLGQKFLYRCKRLMLRLSVNGNIYDPSQFWRDEFKNRIIDELKRRGIKKVIVTGAPFSYMFYALDLKKINPGIKLFADFRDLWVDSKLGYGDHVLKFQGKKRYNEEVRRQAEVLQKFDHIWVVSEDIKNIFKFRYAIPDTKIEVVMNGFDPEDGIAQKSGYSPFNGKIRFLYIGTVNCGREYYLRFLNAAARLSLNNKSLYERTEFIFVGNENKNFIRDVENLGIPAIQFYPRMNIAELMNFSSNFDFLLYFKMESDLQNSFGTKFFDYLRFRLPVVLLSPQGSVTEFLRTNKTGYVLDEENVYSSLSMLLEKHMKNELIFDLEQAYPYFNIKQISEKLANLLA